MKVSADAHRRGFSMWLRKGFWPDPFEPQQIERKYNPWHDPANGEFTFTGQGRHYGAGSSSRSVSTTPGQRPPLQVDVSNPPPRRKKRFRGGRGDFGGAGSDRDFLPDAAAVEHSERQRASALRRATEAARRSTANPLAPAEGAASPTNIIKAELKTVVSNGYTFKIDNLKRTREVSGSITENPNQTRSQSSQDKAGGKDRRSTDEGGHFIARQFNGPREYFNHFAQDRNFNQSAYRRLENQWLREIRKGKQMPVRIVPHYRGDSMRPYELDVYFVINGEKQSLKFPNESKRKSDGKR